MVIWRDESWGLHPQVKSTEAGPWVGVAFGPDSWEGLARVNGHLLAAGQVLPLSSEGGTYQVEALGGTLSNNGIYDDFQLRSDADEAAGAVGKPRPIELVLFTDPLEMACYSAARPPQLHVTPFITIAATGAFNYGSTDTMLKVPCTGRRAVHVAIYMEQDGGQTETVNVEAWGLRYTQLSPTQGARMTSSRAKKLYTAALAWLADANWQPFCADRFIIGGTNEAEAYDHIGFYARRAASANACRLRFETLNVGELL